MDEDESPTTKRSRRTSSTSARTTGPSGTGTTKPPATFSATTRNIRSPSTTSRGTSATAYIRRSSGVSARRNAGPGDRSRQQGCRAACPECCGSRCSATMAKSTSSGCVDPGYPKPVGIRQAMLMLPPGADWKGLRLKAELEVKGVRYPVRWACRQKINADGSLTLRHNYKPDQPLV